MKRAGKPRLAASSRYVPAIDGLRAFAVLAVIFYHMGLDWAPGGLMGVTVFFVISGYLINGLLVAEHERTGTISLTRFWLRRARRIIPAVLLAIAGTIVLCALISPALLDKARPDIAPSLFFYNNWWQVFRDLSYFEAAGAPSPLTHYWSLAIEEQFYIVWPFLLMLLFRCKLGKKPMAAIIIVLACASALEMALLFDPHGDPSRIYYGTDTRAVSLLIGAWLALAWPSKAFDRHAETRTRIRETGNGHIFFREIESEPIGIRKLGSKGLLLLNIAGIAALVGLVLIVCFTNGYTSFPYYGGIALTSVLSALLIAALVVPETWAARIMQVSPLVWIGKRSYGMYLWHFPIILLTSKLGMPIDVPWWVRIAQLVIIFAIADLSYRFVEDPIRKGAIGSWLRSRKTADNQAIRGAQDAAGQTDDLVETDASSNVPANGNRVAVRERASQPKRGTMCRRATVLVVSCIIVGAVTGLVLVQPPVDPRKMDTPISELISHARPRAEAAIAIEKKRIADEREEQQKRAAQTAYDELFEKKHVNRKGETVYEPLLIGDSVPAGAIDEFYDTFPNGCIDAVVGRNVWESPYADYLGTHQVGTYVVFCIGTNNAVTDEQIDELLANVTDDKKIVMVNIRSTYEGMKPTNKAIEKAPSRHPNIVAVVDWYHAAENHAEYFQEDGTHLMPEGAHAYISLIKKAIETSMGIE